MTCSFQFSYSFIEWLETPWEVHMQSCVTHLLHTEFLTLNIKYEFHIWTLGLFVTSQHPVNHVWYFSSDPPSCHPALSPLCDHSVLFCRRALQITCQMVRSCSNRMKVSQLLKTFSSSPGPVGGEQWYMSSVASYTIRPSFHCLCPRSSSGGFYGNRANDEGSEKTNRFMSTQH